MVSISEPQGTQLETWFPHGNFRNSGFERGSAPKLFPGRMTYTFRAACGKTVRIWFSYAGNSTSGSHWNFLWFELTGFCEVTTLRYELSEVYFDPKRTQTGTAARCLSFRKLRRDQRGIWACTACDTECRSDCSRLCFQTFWNIAGRAAQQAWEGE